MSEENKCVGLDCEMCGNTKCPNEEKESIINGIDVSECNFRLERNGKQKCECTHATGFGVICDCEKWQNCYFKQLKRLEKENEELKKELDFKEKQSNDFMIKSGEMVEKLNNLNTKYKQDLEEIRETLMCKIYGLNENASQLDYMCHALDKFEKIRIKILTKINEVLNDRD